METVKKNKRTILRGMFFVSVVIAIIISLSALWLHRVFYNQGTLSQIATTALAEQSSRDSIGRYVADRVFEERPVIGQVAGPRLASLISSLLGTDIASTVTDRLVERTRIVLTSKHDEDVSINLAPIKDTVVKIQSLTGVSEESRNVKTEDIPDEIVLIESDSFPDFYRIGILVLWLGPISMIFTLSILGYWIYKGRKNALWVRLRIGGVLFAVSALLALLIGPLAEPLFISIAREAPAQTLLSNLYDGLISPFNQQAYVLLFIGVAIVISSYLLPLVQKSNKNK